MFLPFQWVMTYNLKRFDTPLTHHLKLMGLRAKLFQKAMKLSLHRHNKHTHMELASCLIAGSVEKAFILLCGELTALIDVTANTVLHHLKIFRTRLDVITLV